ncbi:MAG: hypothetical protein KDA78_04250, partial [Planctomycetaceae bacterium]|nr:hypothetical protein [Planctomycetaceae bacterium]
DPNNALPGLVKEISENAALIDALYVRILNRNATSTEIEIALPYFAAVQQEHEKLTKLLAEKEEWWKPIRQQKEQERLEKIAAAEKTLAAYKVELAPRLEQAEAERKQKIEAAQSALAEYESKIQEPFEKWLTEQKPAAEIPWDVFTPSQLTASNKAELKQQEDGSILATAKDGIGNYELIAQIEPTTLQAFRLEALTDPQLPGMGPGLPPNGNFVVTEFEVFIKPLSDPNATPVPVKLDRAQADFSQDGFDIKTAIDGSMAANSNGWAVSPQVGITHWATFQTKEPVVISEKSELKIVIHQRYTDKKHWLGKFRISTTAHSTPVPLGLPKDLLALVNLAERTPEQNQELISFFQRSDAEYQKRKAAIGEAQKPLPPDPELVRLEGVLKATQAPVADDPALVELRSDVAMSQKLLENDRLTVAQDLTWALINSPSFLFNR